MSSSITKSRLSTLRERTLMNGTDVVNGLSPASENALNNNNNNPSRKHSPNPLLHACELRSPPPALVVAPLVCVNLVS
jgi:hypothetical protein